MKIVHIADVHWRGLTRHEEYKDSFTDMFNQCKMIKPDAIVVAGDIVHNKTQGISPELIDCLRWWFTEMNNICDTYVMLGNHDGLVLNTDRQDAISPILRALNLPNVHLYRDSGVFPCNKLGVNWCVFSPFDELNYSNVVPKNNGNINIALYHGAVWGSHTDTNYMLDGETGMSLFKPFDFTMLGDIHKTQQLDKDGRVWYCGSTIQQNYGESMDKGFLLWDIVDRDNFTVEFRKVKHNVPFATVDWAGDIDSTSFNCMTNWPKKSRFRIRAFENLDPKTQRKLSNKLRREHNAEEVVYKIDLRNDKTGLTVDQTNKVKLEDLSNPETHKRLLRDYSADESHKDEVFWTKVDKIVDELVPNLKSISDFRSAKWSVKKMNFDNTFGYGKDNTINFSKLNGIVGLFGKNRCGKSSIPGTLMYSLFNSNDRGLTSIMHVINNRSQECNADVVFSVNGKPYRLERQSVRYRNPRGEGAMSYLNLFEIDNDENIVRDLSGEQRKDTEKSLRELIGSSDEFMMTSFAAQGNMNNFINKGATDRKKTLSSFLGLDVYDNLSSVIREESAGIKSLMKRYDQKDWEKEILACKENLKNLKINKEKLKFDISELTAEYDKIKSEAKNENKDFVDPNSLVNLEKLIKKENKKLADVNEEIKDKSEQISRQLKYIIDTKKILDNVDIDFCHKTLDLINNVNTSISKIKIKYSKEHSLLNNQKKSVKLLNQVPCGNQFPTCKFIAESHKNKLLLSEQKTLVKSLKGDIDNLKEKILEYDESELKDKIKKYNALENKLSQVNNNIALLKEQIISLKYAKKEIEKSIAMKTKDAENIKLLLENSDNAIISAINKKLADITTHKKQKKNKLHVVLQNIGSEQRQIEKLIQDQKEFDDLQVEWTVYDFLLRATSWRGIPTFIMEKQMPVINLELSRILEDVTGFTVELEVDERNTNIFINYGDSRRPIECGSGMEKMVSSMALRVALSNVSSLNKSDMFIVDEGFGALDPQNIEAVTGLLKRFKKYYRLILIISHVDVIKDSVDDMLEITKNGRDAKISYE